MARIFTSKTYAESYSIAERNFLEVAEHQLDDSFYVIHGLPWRSLDNTWQQGESDFVILQRELGLIVVEAKPGTIRLDATGWKDADGQPITDPVIQAQQGMHNVQRLLCQRVPRWSDQQVPHTFAVYLCKATGFNGRLPISLRPEQVIFESDLNNLAATLIR
ncbi:MAG: nuclease-related domain-containing protein [Planctomycetota bacterium]